MRRVHPLKNASRLKTILGVFAKYGFQSLIQRVKLGRYVLSASPEDQHSAPERLRKAFEELGPAFVKFGQLLATRPDLIPKEYCREFKRLQSEVQTLPYAQIQPVLRQHFGKPIEEVFRSFDEEPLAAASIAQVYKAVLKNGERVVVKVQRPGITSVIRDDLNILYFLADLIHRYIPEADLFNPMGIVEEFSKSLALETNFIVEANNIRRFSENFKDEAQIKVPEVYREISGQRVLVMEELEGLPLSRASALTQEGVDPQQVMRTGLKCYLKMVFNDGLFHGDLHAGNMFVLPDGRVGLIDFGAVGRLNGKTQSAIANMLVALATEDYDRLAFEYVDLAPYTEYVDVDRFAKDLRDLISPYYGLSLRHFNVGRTLMDSSQIAAKYKLVLPSELILFFKSIIAIEGMGNQIANDFDFLSYALEFASELVQTRYEPAKLLKDFSFVARDLNSLISSSPRQMKQLLRRLNSPDYKKRIEIGEFSDFRRSVESSSNLLFLGLVIGSLILSASVLMTLDRGPMLMGWPVFSVISYGVAMALSFIAFINYIRRF